LDAERCLAFNIFDALPMHTVAVAYSGPIHPTGHKAPIKNVTRASGDLNAMALAD
jgi:hypothetical protein